MTGRPNVLILVCDALRYDRLGRNGYRRGGERLTRNIDALAEEGMVYERAIAPGPATKFSQTAFMTGQYPSNTGWTGTYSELGEGTTVLSEIVDGRGYATLGIHTAQIAKDAGFSRGFDRFVEMGNLPYLKPEWDFIECGLYNMVFGRDSRTRHKNKILKRFVDDAVSEGTPFFSYVCYTNTHNPYRAPWPFSRLERDIEEGMDAEAIEYLRGWGNAMETLSGTYDLSAEEIDVLESYYDASVAYLDHRLGEIIEHLRERGVYDDTMIVVTADHGELFGEGGMFYHQYSIRDELIHVPLVVKYPDGGPTGIEEAPVSLLDVFPTIMDLLGVEQDVELDGTSLLDGGTAVPLSEMARPTEEAIRSFEEQGIDDAELRLGKKVAWDGEHKLVLRSDGETILYRLPDESDGIEDEAVRGRLLDQIEGRLGGFARGRESLRHSEEVEDRLRKLGYF